MATINTSVVYLDSVGWAAVQTWHTPWSPITGTLCRQSGTPTTNFERVFVAGPATSGTAVGGTEPSWTTSPVTRTKITDNLVTWYDVTGVALFNGDLANTLTWAQNKAKFPSGGIGYVITDAARTSVFIQTVVSGAYSGSEPTWVTSPLSATTSDGSNTWMYIGAVTDFTIHPWGAPAARLPYLITNMSSGTTVYIGDDHAETQTTAMSLTAPASATTYLYCMDHTAAFPLNSTNLRTTATITTTGVSAITLTNPLYVYGVKFSQATGASGSTFQILPNAGNTSYFDNCTISLPQTASKSLVLGSSGTNSGKVVLNNTPVTFGNVLDNINSKGAHLVWRNTSGYGFTGGTLPASPFSINLASNAIMLIDSIDLSNLTTNALVSGAGQGTVVLQNCKLVSGWTIGTLSSSTGGEVNVSSSDSGTTTYSSARVTERGTQFSDATIYRSGGASDGATAISWRLATVNPLWITYFDALPLGIWNTTVGSSVNVTLYGMYNGTTLPTSGDIWIEVSGMATAGSLLGTIVSTGTTNPLVAGSAYSADTSIWTAPPRVGNTLYSVTSPPACITTPGSNCVFACTQTGTNSVGLPPAYATAVDGQVITDGSAQFRAMMRFSMTATITPQLIGDLYVSLKVAKSSAQFWVDPLIVLS